MEELTRQWRKTPKDTAYCIIGKAGAIHFWFMETPHSIFGESKCGGVEIHRRSPEGTYQESKEADHDNCWLLNAPCWHDGSSLMASEQFIPLWESCNDANDFEFLWLSLENVYRSNFQEIELATPTPSESE